MTTTDTVPQHWTDRHPLTHPQVRLAIRREELDLTIREAAAACGLNPGTYWRAEAGCECKLSTALAIAKTFGRAVEQLWPND